eukprot:1324545-Rhodomonas_salina.2
MRQHDTTCEGGDACGSHGRGGGRSQQQHHRRPRPPSSVDISNGCRRHSPCHVAQAWYAPTRSIIIPARYSHGTANEVMAGTEKVRAGTRRDGVASEAAQERGERCEEQIAAAAASAGQGVEMKLAESEPQCMRVVCCCCCCYCVCVLVKGRVSERARR